MAGRLAGGSANIPGAKLGYWEKPKSGSQPSDINYDLAQKQNQIPWDTHRPLNSVGSPDVENYDYKVDLDFNREGLQDYNNNLRYGEKG